MLKFLQSGRGVAALMVVVYHLGTTIFGNADYWPQELWVGFRAGHSGVYFFFVLSGFIITWAHMGDIGDRAALEKYGFRRLTRVYPVYWIVLFAIVPIYFLFPEMGEGYETQRWHILSSALLLPTERMPVLPVAWTLRHEILFYLIFAALIIGRQFGLAILSAWFLGCLISLFASLNVFPASFFFSPLNLLFPMGMASALLVRRGRLPGPAVIMVVGLAAFAVAGWLDVRGGMAPPWLAVGYGIASALIIVSGVELERSEKLTPPQPLKIFGDASYALYLIHYPILSAMAKIYFALHLDALTPAWFGFGTLLTGAVLAGLLFHFWVERPIIKVLRRLEPRSPSVRRPEDSAERGDHSAT